MMKENLVSIIIPCFNGEKYLNDTLSSVLWQTYTNWECILVDDGSTDNTYSLYLQFMQRDKRFKYFKKNQEGPSAARNFGVLKSSGDFIQFLDADDIILPERLELCLKEFEKNPSIDAVYTDYITFQARQGYSKILPARMPSSDTIKSLLFENNLTFAIIIHSLLFRAHAVKQNPFDLLLHSYGEDVECWLRMALNGARFHYYDKVLSIYRYTQNSLGSDEVQLYQAKLSILQKYSTHPKCVGYKIEFHNTLLYYHQRLVIAYFMKRSLKLGFIEMKKYWSVSNNPSKIKMLGWGILMLFFRKETIARIRAWIVKRTPLKWGEWKNIQTWQPPKEVEQLLGK